MPREFPRFILDKKELSDCLSGVYPLHPGPGNPDALCSNISGEYTLVYGGSPWKIPLHKKRIAHETHNAHPAKPLAGKMYPENISRFLSSIMLLLYYLSFLSGIILVLF